MLVWGCLMISAGEVVELYNSRVHGEGSEKQVMREIADLYDGDIVVPLPEFQTDERPAIANIARQGINQTAQRIASVFPEIEAMPAAATKRELDKARSRRRAFYAFHELNRSQRKIRRAARYLVGYASAPLRVRPNMSGEFPQFDVRSPLSTYACPTGDPDDMLPPDCIFANRQTLGWLRRSHPEAAASLGVKKGDTADTTIDVLEYVDSDVIWLVAARRQGEGSGEFDFNNSIASGEIHLAADWAPIAMVPNRAGMPLVVVPGEISLSQQRSGYHQIVGMYQRAAEMDALAYIATRQGILGETWVIANPSEEPELRQAPNPFEGVPGIIKGGSVQHRNTPPQFMERTAVGDLERAQRLTVGLPAELGGEAAANVRTGRRADQLLAAVLDFPVQEAHQLFEESLEHVNEAMARIDHAYFPRSEKVYAVRFGAERGDLAYKPGELWVDSAGLVACRSKVSYFAAGLDAGDRIVALGQRLGMGTISQETVMRHDPLVDDVEGEKSRSTAESIERAILTQVQTLAASPESPFSVGDFSSLIKKVRSGVRIDLAWDDVEQEIEERRQAELEAQQAQVPAGAEMMMGGAVGAGPEAEVAGAIAPPPEDLRNLSSMLTAARSPAAFVGPQG